MLLFFASSLENPTHVLWKSLLYTTGGHRKTSTVQTCKEHLLPFPKPRASTTRAKCLRSGPCLGCSSSSGRCTLYCLLAPNQRLKTPTTCTVIRAGIRPEVLNRTRTYNPRVPSESDSTWNTPQCFDPDHGQTNSCPRCDPARHWAESFDKILLDRPAPDQKKKSTFLHFVMLV